MYTNYVKYEKIHLEINVIPVICENLRTSLPSFNHITLDYLVTCLYTVSYYIFQCSVFHVEALILPANTPHQVKLKL